LADPVAGPRVVGAAAAVIGELHRRTGSTVVIDGGVLERWVGVRLRVLAAASGNRPAMDRLASRLAAAFEGRTVGVGWVHGDFWPGNVIFDPGTLQVTGIIDWEWAGPGELPAHDLLYLLIQTRMLAQGRELGHVLQALLEGAPWEPAERTILEAAGVIGRGEATVERETLLLVWLRHVASNLVQSPGDARNWIWTGRNVESVLRLV
ncbi:MAG TPA: phosphotransferase, partial [Acidimicrobiia bacterium]|nr:phosphotransferase [Acidimicrobiia bacterium]